MKLITYVCKLLNFGHKIHVISQDYNFLTFGGLTFGGCYDKGKTF